MPAREHAAEPEKTRGARDGTRQSHGCGTSVALHGAMADIVENQVEVVEPMPASASPGPGYPVSSTVVSEAPSSLRWGAIIGGTVAALGIGALLYSLGLALGLSAIDPEDPGSLRPSSIFTGVWALVVPLVALFVGGFVAARGAGAWTRMSSALHGLVMWGLTVVAGMWLLGTIASTLVSGAAAMGRTAVSVIDRDASRDAAAEFQGRAERAQERARRNPAESREEALQVAEDTGKAFWGVFGALLLGVIAAIGGALAGTAKRGRRRPQPTTTRGRPEPRIQHREAYP